MNREDHEEQSQACRRSPLCQLIDEHPGSCDPRTMDQRFRALVEHLDQLVAAGLDFEGEELGAMVEVSAVASMAAMLAGGRA